MVTRRDYLYNVSFLNKESLLDIINFHSIYFKSLRNFIQTKLFPAI